VKIDIVKIRKIFVGVLAGALAMTIGLANSPVWATGLAEQDQNAQSTSKKKPSSTQKKSNARELSEEQGGARGFQLPGDGTESKAAPKTQAKKTKAGDKGSKAAPDHSPKKQP
jgi:hypothetical protein